jgi:hypothetical protein
VPLKLESLAWQFEDESMNTHIKTIARWLGLALALTGAAAQAANISAEAALDSQSLVWEQVSGDAGLGLSFTNDTALFGSITLNGTTSNDPGTGVIAGTSGNVDGLANANVPIATTTITDSGTGSSMARFDWGFDVTGTGSGQFELTVPYSLLVSNDGPAAWTALATVALSHLGIQTVSTSSLGNGILSMFIDVTGGTSGTLRFEASTAVSTVPVPAPLVLLLSSLFGLGTFGRRAKA